MPKGAGILALIGGAPKAGGPAPIEAESNGKELALQDLFSAAKSGDWAAAAEAFKRAYDECAMGAESEPESESYEE